jgi:hypothetical protein
MRVHPTDIGRDNVSISPDSLSRFDFNRRKMAVESLRLIAARRGDFYNPSSTICSPIWTVCR